MTPSTPPEGTTPRDVGPRTRRLGRLDYVLIALIVLGVAVTVVMAILYPSL